MAPPKPNRPRAVVTISSNKGGVGKTTLATNLAIYLRALCEDLPVLLVPLDDQTSVDRMFCLRRQEPFQGNLEHGFVERDFSQVIQLGQYGVHFVPSPPDSVSVKERARDVDTLSRILAHTAWDGIVLLDTKSDLDVLTRNAYRASDRVIVPVSDWASLEEAGKLLELLETTGPGADRARLVFTLVDRRSKVGSDRPLYRGLADEAHARGWPYYKTHISRSPRVEALNSGGDRPLSVLHHARGTAVHSQLRELAVEVLHDIAQDAHTASGMRLEIAEQPASRPRPRASVLGSAARLSTAWRRVASGWGTEER